MPASPSTARAINDRLALRLLQQEGPLTAGRLKQLTGLSRPTVADLVERLTAAGLISVVGESGEQRRGPNAKVYGIVADLAHLAALDVRTEGVCVVVTDVVGEVLAEASVPIGDDTGTGPAVEQAVALVERAAKEAGAEQLHTVGIGAPGLIDPATGELRDSGGLPVWHRRLVAALQERLPEARVIVENETNLAALAEQRDGAARDRDTFVLLWLGHGTGAAVVLDGTLRRGLPAAPARSASCRCRGRDNSPRPRTARVASTPSPQRRRSSNWQAYRAWWPPPRPTSPTRRPWSGRPRRPLTPRPTPASSTSSRTASPSAPRPSSQSSIRGVWCWAARSAGRAATYSPPVSRNGSPVCPPPGGGAREHAGRRRGAAWRVADGTGRCPGGAVREAGQVGRRASGETSEVGSA